MQEEMAALVREQFTDSAATSRRLMTCTSLSDAMAVQIGASARMLGRTFGRGQAMVRLGQAMIRAIGRPGRGGQ
jgi:hypothetical protein